MQQGYQLSRGWVLVVGLKPVLAAVPSACSSSWASVQASSRMSLRRHLAGLAQAVLILLLLPLPLQMAVHVLCCWTPQTCACRHPASARCWLRVEPGRAQRWVWVRAHPPAPGCWCVMPVSRGWCAKMQVAVAAAAVCRQPSHRPSQHRPAACFAPCSLLCRPLLAQHVPQPAAADACKAAWRQLAAAAAAAPAAGAPGAKPWAQLWHSPQL